MSTALRITNWLTLEYDTKLGWFFLDSQKNRRSVLYGSKMEAWQAYRLSKIDWIFN